MTSLKQDKETYYLMETNFKKMQAREPVELFGYMLPPEFIAFIIVFTAAPIYICILHAFPVYFVGEIRQVRRRTVHRRYVSPGQLEKMYEEKMEASKKTKVWGFG